MAINANIHIQISIKFEAERFQHFTHSFHPVKWTKPTQISLQFIIDAVHFPLPIPNLRCRPASAPPIFESRKHFRRGIS